MYTNSEVFLVRELTPSNLPDLLKFKSDIDICHPFFAD
jgi:hypothetical protein